jgi:hypothetical protein
VPADLTAFKFKPIVATGRIVALSLLEAALMNELVRPLVQAWNWVDRVGGFPGQVLFVVAVIMIIIGALTWFSNRK